MRTEYENNGDLMNVYLKLAKQVYSPGEFLRAEQIYKTVLSSSFNLPDQFRTNGDITNLSISGIEKTTLEILDDLLVGVEEKAIVDKLKKI